MKDIPLIVDTGASICISPCHSDFTTYQPSKLKIWDLSSSNKVLGEGTICLSIKDHNGQTTTLELPGYHIPTAKVCLLSPQVLLQISGGTSIQTTTDMRLNLSTGIKLTANYCPRSRLPMLQWASSHQCDLWQESFTFDHNPSRVYTNILGKTNTNLSAAQKEVLLWHQRLSHASIPWIQTLMRDRHWLSSQDNYALHKGPFIPCKEDRGPRCDITGLKCAACLTAKATLRTPRTHGTATLKHRSHSPNKHGAFHDQLISDREMILKQGHTKPGDCVSADHYISAIQVVYSTHLVVKNKAILAVLSLLTTQAGKYSTSVKFQRLLQKQLTASTN